MNNCCFCTRWAFCKASSIGVVHPNQTRPLCPHPLRENQSAIRQASCSASPNFSRRSSIQLAFLATLSFLKYAPPAHAVETLESESKAVQDFRNVSGLQDLAFEFTNQQKFEQAEYIWTKLISLNENNAAAYSNRGNCRTSQGKFESAISDFNKAIELAPDEPDPFLGKGVALEGLRQYHSALDCYILSNQRSQKKYGAEDPVALNNIGNAHSGLNQWQDAYESFKKAADMDSRFVFALANEALALYQMGRDNDALQKMRFLVRKYPAFSDMHAAVAMVAWQSGNQEQAENEWYKAVQQDSRYEDVLWVKNIRRWPPRLVSSLESFRTLGPRQQEK